MKGWGIRLFFTPSVLALFRPEDQSCRLQRFLTVVHRADGDFLLTITNKLKKVGEAAREQPGFSENLSGH